MDISQTRAFSGLRMVATPTASLVTNDVTIGVPSTNTAIADVDTGYAVRALIVGASSDLVLDLADNLEAIPLQNVHVPHALAPYWD